MTGKNNDRKINDQYPEESSNDNGQDSQWNETGLPSEYDGDWGELTEIIDERDVYDTARRGYILVNESELDDDRYYEDDNGEYELRDHAPIRFRRDGKTGLLGGLMYAVFVISVSVILACVGWVCASDVLALNKAEHTELVTVSKDFTIDEVADSLKDAGIIEYKFLFKLFADMSDAAEEIDPGTYEMSTQFDYQAIVRKMTVGSESQVVTTVVFPEGFTMKEIFERLEENNICSVEDLQEAAASYQYSYSFLDAVQLGDENRLEGYLFPDTYDFYEGMQAASALNKLLNNFHYKITAEMEDNAESLGITFHEGIIIASMIEKEAANDEERATIASVIYNRLNAGMPLQIDATIQYILSERKAVLSTEDTQIDSPYNTYLYTGIPAGPISNPGIASINAAFKPEQTGYYYYALDESTGTHKFFATSYEHEAFVATQSYGQ